MTVSAAPAPKAGTFDLCDVCERAVVYRNGWRHAVHGEGRDHDPAPRRHPADTFRPGTTDPAAAIASIFAEVAR